MTNVYKNANKFIELANQYMACEHIWWPKGNALEKEITEQAKLLQAEIESHPFQNEPAKSLLYLTTTKRKIESLFEYGTNIVLNLLSPRQHRIILENGLNSSAANDIISEVLNEAYVTGAFHLISVLFGVADLVERSKPMRIEMQLALLRVHTDKLLQTVELTLQDLGHEPEEVEPEPPYIWEGQANYILEVMYELEKKGFIRDNPASDGGVTYHAKAKAIGRLFKLPGKPNAEKPAWRTIETYLKTSNTDLNTKRERPLLHLPSKRKFSEIRPRREDERWD